MKPFASAFTRPDWTAARPRARGLLVPGDNCWRRERAERFRCVQDAAEYFRLVRAAILAARRSVFVLGWDIAAGVDLLPGETDGAGPTRLAELLDFVVRRRRELHCYVLTWDYAALYALERDPLTRWRLGWGTHRRVHFRYDGHHPFGSSHHQKVVVVDDRLAFSGGLDLTGHRWDVPAHPVEHPLRTNAIGQPYTPFHDVQAMVEGQVATALGELARERWRRVGRRRLPPVEPARESLWPEGIPADLEDVAVAIARTEPSFRGRPAVRECERLFLDTIASARRSIYVENQYFTSERLGDALARRLSESDGPELIVVGPRECSGWLEERTMGALRARVLARLQAADRHGRLRLTHPVASRARDVCTFIHSKVLIADDEVLRIGSANLTNRSMGMDTECDLAAVAEGDPRVRAGIAALQDRLLAEHLGCTAADVRAAVLATGSLRGAIARLSVGDHTLATIRAPEQAPAQPSETVQLVADPNEPMRMTRAVDRLLPEIEAGEQRGLVAAHVVAFAALVAAGIVLLRTGEAGAWRTLAEIRALIAAAPVTPEIALAVVAAFVAGSVLFLPLELLVLAAAVVLGPFHGAALALVGALAASALGYAIGRALGPRRLRRLIGARAYTVVRELQGRGAISVAVLRLVPITGSATIHFASGAARVPGGSYVLGTAIGLAPWILALSVLGGLVRRVVLDPGPKTAAAAVLLALGLGALALRLRWALVRAPARREHEGRAVHG